MELQLTGTVTATQLRTRTQIHTPRGTMMGKGGDYDVTLPNGAHYPIPAEVLDAMIVRPKAEPSDSKKPEGDISASWRAIKLAEAENIDLSLVEGSGKNGMITVPDVKEFIAATTAAASPETG